VKLRFFKINLKLWGAGVNEAAGRQLTFAGVDHHRAELGNDVENCVVRKIQAKSCVYTV
jgi:hypothetical protein